MTAGEGGGARWTGSTVRLSGGGCCGAADGVEGRVAAGEECGHSRGEERPEGGTTRVRAGGRVGRAVSPREVVPAHLAGNRKCEE